MKNKQRRLLAVIPARSGSKGLARKNIRELAGVPLLAHSILLAGICPEITRTVVSTDSQEIADIALRYGGEVPFLRPAELAEDQSSMWPVLRHALAEAEKEEGKTYDFLLLLDPTSPAREPRDVTCAFQKLEGKPDAAGIVGVSQPDFNPAWHCVVEQGGWMADLMQGASDINRRQDAKPIYRINGSLYIWRSQFVREGSDSWRDAGKYLLYETPEIRSMSIDTEEEFRKAELLVKEGLISLPWLQEFKESACRP
jgi:CMP-N,N'-diacetyllegionaminic acid synthase